MIEWVRNRAADTMVTVSSVTLLDSGQTGRKGPAVRTVLLGGDGKDAHH